jgi:hypothetical protein
MDRNQEHISPAQHSDVPPDRPERKTGAGREATEATAEIAEEHDKEHRSGYGGKGGKPDTSSDQRPEGGR